jgi:hypothetical protein
MFGSRGPGAARSAHRLQSCGVLKCFAERSVSFQITVLKVLAGQPQGRASVADLTRYVRVLMTSGPDWIERTNSLAARAPQLLDILRDGFVQRDENGWQITDLGRKFLASLEPPVSAVTADQQPSRATPALRSGPIVRRLRLVVDNTRSPSDRDPDRTRWSA